MYKVELIILELHTSTVLVKEKLEQLLNEGYTINFVTAVGNTVIYTLIGMGD